MNQSNPTQDSHVFDAKLADGQNVQEFFEAHDLVTVTGFFRKKDLYDELANEVLPSLDGNHRQDIRIWSAGCSDGRESYSIAMLCHHITRHRKFRRGFNVTGSDISRPQIEIAIKGLYELRKDEKLRLEGHTEYFKYLDDKQVIMGPELQRSVNFRVENILDMHSETPFQIIVCTNVLLYYAAELKEKLILHILNTLQMGGYLYVEAFGARRMTQLGLSRINPGSHFFQKTEKVI